MLDRLKHHKQLCLALGKQPQSHQLARPRPLELVLAEAKRDEVLHLSADPTLEPALQRKLNVLDLLLDLPLVLAEEEEFLEQQLVGDYAQRPHVHLRGVLFSAVYLRRRERIGS